MKPVGLDERRGFFQPVPAEAKPSRCSGLPVTISRRVIGPGLSHLERVAQRCVLYLRLAMAMEGLTVMVAALPVILPMPIALGVDLVCRRRYQ